MKKGFTLLELLVVVLIIGILSAIALPQYRKAVMKTRFTQLKVLAHGMAQAEEIYHLANGQYATKLEDLDIQLPGTSTDSAYYYNWGSCYLGIEDSDTKQNQVCCSSHQIGMEYQVRLHFSSSPDSRGCIAYNTDLNSPQNQICKLETASTTYSSQNESGGYTSWKY